MGSKEMNALNINQMTRWVNTKEEHATKVIHLMSDYCLCQREACQRPQDALQERGGLHRGLEGASSGHDLRCQVQADGRPSKRGCVGCRSGGDVQDVLASVK